MLMDLLGSQQPTRVFSNDFVSGVPLGFGDHPDYVPSIFEHKNDSRIGAVARSLRIQPALGRVLTERDMQCGVPVARERTFQRNWSQLC
ncbi:hypothetical protein V5799_011981 [Amblyomma americanum]|uniref:Uncharacterized protein n=1 Tax=Amblyomma americanum TaxID=6943 RepID=A0AAQ4EFN6_AMBAM